LHKIAANIVQGRWLSKTYHSSLTPNCVILAALPEFRFKLVLRLEKITKLVGKSSTHLAGGPTSARTRPFVRAIMPPRGVRLKVAHFKGRLGRETEQDDGESCG